MRQARLHAALAVAVLTVFLLGAVSDTVYDKQHALQGLNGQIVATKTQIRQLLDQERALQSEIAGLDSQLRAVQAQIDQETAAFYAGNYRRVGLAQSPLGFHRVSGADGDPVPGDGGGGVKMQMQPRRHGGAETDAENSI